MQLERPSRILNSTARLRTAAFNTPNPSAQAAFKSKKSTKSCKFLDDLPAELRNRIYELVLGNSTIHVFIDCDDDTYDSDEDEGTIALADQPLLRSICHMEEGEREHIEEIRTKPTDSEYENHQEFHIDCWHDRGSVASFFALLQTCRQIHSEAALIPYLSNTFSFTNLTSIDQFLRRLIPQQARAVQHIAYTTNSDEEDEEIPATKDWKRLLDGELETLVCCVEFAGVPSRDFDVVAEPRKDELMAFGRLKVEDLKVVAYNVPGDVDENLVTAKKLKEWAKEVETKLKISSKDEVQKKAGKGKSKRN